jgi:hypothetical protein
MSNDEKCPLCGLSYTGEYVQLRSIDEPSTMIKCTCYTSNELKSLFEQCSNYVEHIMPFEPEDVFCSKPLIPNKSNEALRVIP